MFSGGSCRLGQEVVLLASYGEASQHVVAVLKLV